MPITKEIMLDYLLRDPERAADAILAAIDGGAGKGYVKKLIAQAEERGVDVGKAIAAEMKRRNDFFDAISGECEVRPEANQDYPIGFEQHRELYQQLFQMASGKVTVSGKPFRVPCRQTL